MSRFIPVEPEKWGEMVKALSEVKTLKAEIKTLKDQIDQMESHFEDDTKSLSDLEAEIQRLKSKNNLLREAGDDLWYCIRHNDKLGMQEAIEEWKEARHD